MDPVSNSYIVHFNKNSYYQIEEDELPVSHEKWKYAGFLIGGNNDISSFFVPDFYRPYVMVLESETADNTVYICAVISEKEYYFKLFDN